MTNQLIHETSPYLQQHAENPVDWVAWSAESFARAREADKPVFLSIGYSACHWCHVMAHESFEDPKTAQYMNEHFINIKVDREERPDVDAIYMDSVVTMTGQGGWPMSVFLTPDGIPFYGGAYFPPQPRYGIPSFMEVLSHVARNWKDDREQALAYGSRLQEHVGTNPALHSEQEAINPERLNQASKTLYERYDWQAGGWEGAPKFPQPAVIEFLLRRYNRTGDQLALNMVRHVLHSMAKGGMYDVIGGGFHRYSVDKNWLVPHFEKMLYDNATLGQAYLQAYLVCGDPAFRAVAEQTLSFLQREMRDPLGGFYASLDADSEGVEGKFYIWSLDEIRAVLRDPSLSDLVIEAYGISQEGNFEGKNIPFRHANIELLAEHFRTQPEIIESRLAEANAALLDARQARVRPGLDDKILAAWNGLLLQTLSMAAQVLERERYLPIAQDLANFMLEKQTIDGRLMRSWRQGEARFDAFLEDFAAVGLGLLSLYQTDFNPRWYQAAIAYAHRILAVFTDPDGGFFDTADDHERLICRPKSIQDSPTPSSNSLAAALLLRLGALTGDRRYSAPAMNMLIAMQENAGKHPSAFAYWLNQMDFALGPQLQLAIIGDIDAEDFQSLAQTAWRTFHPRLVIAGAKAEAAGDPALLKGRTMLEGKATAYLCQGFTCQLPATSAEILSMQFEKTSGSEKGSGDRQQDIIGKA